MAWSFGSGSSVSSVRSPASESAQSNHDTAPTEMNEPYSPAKARRPVIYSSPDKAKLRNSNGSSRHADEPPVFDCHASPKRRTWKNPPPPQSLDGGTDLAIGCYVPLVQRRRKTPSPKQLNRLIVALISSPCMQYHVRRQWWDEELASDSNCADEPNYPHAPDGRKASIVNGHALDVLDSYLPQERRNSSNSENIAVLEAHIEGTPIQYTTPDFYDVGHCLFAEVSYGASTSARLRLNRPLPGKSPIYTVTMQVIARIVERRSGRRAGALASEMDVTAATARAALTELDAFEDSHVVNHIPNLGRESDNSYSEISHDGISDAQIDSAISHISRLTPETCTMQTLILMSALKRARRRHAQFAIVHTDGATHDSGVPKSGCIRWTSASHHFPRVLREELIELITRRAHLAAPFIARVPLEWIGPPFGDVVNPCDNEGGLAEMAIQCVPLFGSAGWENAAIWVCFVRSAADSIPV